MFLTRPYATPVALLALVLAAIAPGSAHAAVATWGGSASTDWTHPANWVEGSVPAANDDVVISGIGGSAPRIDLGGGPVTIASLTLGLSQIARLVVDNGDAAARALVVTGDVLIGPYGVVTHSSQGTVQSGVLNVQCGGNFVIETGGAVDVSMLGYQGGSNQLSGAGPGAGGRVPGAGSGGGAGGAHAGNGGHSVPPATIHPGGSAYGVVVEPTTLGSGGSGSDGYGGGSGGGAIKLTVVGVLNIDGSILAVGGDALSYVLAASGAGAGGSVWLEAGTVSGFGIVSANGGRGGPVVSRGGGGGGGGGGRLSVNYDILAQSLSFSAAGGPGAATLVDVTGGAGTQYFKLRAEPVGRLVFDNAGRSGRESPMRGDFAVQQLSILDGSHVKVTPGSRLTLQATSVITSGDAHMEIESTGAWIADALTTLADFRLTNRSTLNLPSLVDLAGCFVINHGIYNHSSGNFHIPAGAIWHENGWVPAIGVSNPIADIVVDGTLEFWNQSKLVPASFESLVVNSGAMVTHRNNSDAQASTLHLELGTLMVRAGGAIDTDGRGYSGGAQTVTGFGPGGSTASSSSGSGGGSYGGTGGTGGGGTQTVGGSTYGSVAQPTDIGSGGGGGGYDGRPGRPGGGAIRLIVTGIATIEGSVSARGMGRSIVTTAGGAGSGGSVWIDTAAFAGTGVVSAEGGCAGAGGIAGGAGGGGRIALYSGTGGFKGIVSADAGSAEAVEFEGTAGTIHVEQRNLSPVAPFNLGPLAAVSGAHASAPPSAVAFEQDDHDVGDMLRYGIQVDNNADFSSPVIDYISEPMPAGPTQFTFGQAAGGGTYIVGDANIFLAHSAYYWRVRSHDSSDAVSAFTLANAGGTAFFINDAPTVAIDSPALDSVHEWVGSISGTAGDIDGAVASVEVALFEIESAKYFEGTGFASEIPVWIFASSSLDHWSFDSEEIFRDDYTYSVAVRVTDSLGQVVHGTGTSFRLSAADACSPPGTCQSLEIESGSGQSGVVGSTLPLPLMVRVVDSAGASMEGIAVDWQGVSPDSSVDPAVSISNGEGLAWTIATLGTGVGIGSDVFSASIYAYPSTTQLFVATSYDEDVAGSTGLAAVLTVTPDNAAAPALVSLDGSASTPTDGAELLSYRWELGDGRVVAAGPSLLSGILYGIPGSFGVGVEIRDSFGNKDSAKHYITIRKGTLLPPSAKIQWQVVNPAALEVQFSCDCSDGDGEIVSSLWEYGDGDQTELVQQSHVYSEPGSYRVRLSVEDDSGLRGYDQALIVVSVGDLIPPVARIGASVLEGAAPLSVTFTADFHDEDGSVVGGSWELSGESVDQSDEIVRTFTEPGYYRAQLNVWDNDGLGGHDEVTVTVRQGAVRPPRIVSEASAVARVGQPYRYDGDGLPSAQGTRPLFWRLLTVEDGVEQIAGGNIATDPDHGSIGWTPTSEQAGLHRFRLEVRNEAGVATEDFTVQVADDGTPETSSGNGRSAGCEGVRNQTGGTLWLLCLTLVGLSVRRENRHS